MKELMMNRRRRLSALAVMAALVLTFAVPSFTRVVAQSSSSQVSTASGVVPPSAVAVGPAGIPRTGTNILAFVALAAVAIALGSYMVAWERAMPVGATTLVAPRLTVPTSAASTPAASTPAVPPLYLAGRWRGAARVARQFSRR